MASIAPWFGVTLSVIALMLLFVTALIVWALTQIYNSAIEGCADPDETERIHWLTNTDLLNISLLALGIAVFTSVFSFLMPQWLSQGVTFICVAVFITCTRIVALRGRNHVQGKEILDNEEH